ncbi:MAG: DUF2625 domain-containing protein [Prevotella sp.]|jgi:hypothetical protein|nr:DUF2625 domain-containing protein [Prevotella sp.]
MRTLQELINTEDPGWTIVQEWIDKAKNKVEVLPCKKEDAEEALVNTQVTTRSLMGAIVYKTGGLLVDNGWIRIFGTGSERMKRSLPGWNKEKTFKEYGEAPPYLLVADDVIGGLYAINGGHFGADRGNIYYFAPDMLKWIPLKMGYSQFLLFCFETDMDEFYNGLRWDGWQEDVKALDADCVFNFFPFLWTKEGKDVNNSTRKAVPVDDAYDLNMELKNTL